MVTEGGHLGWSLRVVTEGRHWEWSLRVFVVLSGVYVPYETGPTINLILRPGRHDRWMSSPLHYRGLTEVGESRLNETTQTAADVARGIPDVST